MTKSTIVERKIEETTQNVVSIKRFSSNRLPSGAPSVEMRCFVNKPPYIILEIALRGDTLESGLPILAVKMNVSFYNVSIDKEDFRRREHRVFGHWRGLIYSNHYLSEDDRQAIAEYGNRGRHGQQLVESDCDYVDIERDFEYAFSVVKSGRSGFGFGGLDSIMDLIDDYHMNLEVSHEESNFTDQNINVDALAEAWNSGQPTPWLV